MEPRSGIIFCKNRPGPTSQSSLLQSMVFYVSLSPPIMSVPTYHVCPHLSCLSPPIMSVPTYYVCPHLPIMSVPTYFVCPTYYVCPHLLCLSPPIMSVVLLVWGNGYVYYHTRLHLWFSAKLRIWQVPACNMETRSGIIFCKNRPNTSRPHPTLPDQPV